MSWGAPLAGLMALACIALALRTRAGLSRLAPPNASASLLDELYRESASEDPELARRWALAELNQRLADVAFALDLRPATFTTLTRICLAAGPALGLVDFLQLARSRSLPAAAISAAVCAFSGLVGGAAVHAIGRSAKARVAEIRREWDRLSREVGKVLGASLDSGGARGGREISSGTVFPA